MSDTYPCSELVVIGVGDEPVFSDEEKIFLEQMRALGPYRNGPSSLPVTPEQELIGYRVANNNPEEFERWYKAQGFEQAGYPFLKE